VETPVDGQNQLKTGAGHNLGLNNLTCIF
jgi:hypothetical protein